jgi:hypothetical protein
VSLIDLEVLETVHIQRQEQTSKYVVGVIEILIYTPGLNTVVVYLRIDNAGLMTCVQAEIVQEIWVVLKKVLVKMDR